MRLGAAVAWLSIMQVPLAKSGMYRRTVYSAIAINFLRLDILIENGFEISSKPFCLPGTLKNVYAESEGGGKRLWSAVAELA